MIKDTTFIANITRYYNYLKRNNNWNKTHVATLPNMQLLWLLTRHYENSCNFIYKIEVKQ